MKKIQILVVEDERIVGADIQMSVERIGYEVPEIAHSAEDAIKKAQSLRPEDFKALMWELGPVARAVGRGL